MMFNAATSEWSRDSAFSDLSVLTANIRTMSSKLKQETQTAHDHSNEPTTVVTDKDDLPGQSLFIKTCAACHTVGKGAKVGPDLSGVTTRRSREWIVDYLVDPVKMRAKGDPTALQLAKEFPTVRMPSLSLSTDDAADLIGYVEALTRATTAYGANTGAAAHEPGTPEPPGQTNAAHHH
jgi:protein SCO1/2